MSETDAESSSAALATVWTLADASSEAAATATDWLWVCATASLMVWALDWSWAADVETESTIPPTADSTLSARCSIAARRSAALWRSASAYWARNPSASCMAPAKTCMLAQISPISSRAIRTCGSR